jgi:hypothetical protein
MEVGDSEKRRRVQTAIRKAARIARSRGVPVVPLKEAREHLQAMFDNPFELAEVVLAYDHLDDMIVFNPEHAAWQDMVAFLRDRQRFYSTQHPQHLVRHELGHAAHYRAISASPGDRDRIWHAEGLGIEQARIAQKVSGRAMWNPKEFVAEVYAGAWAKVHYDAQVVALFNEFRGVWP